MKISGTNNMNIFVDSEVNKDFANNTIKQYGLLLQNSSANVQPKKLVILKNAENASKLNGLGEASQTNFEGDSKIAYGLYDKKADTIFILEDNHQRKDTSLEGDITSQGADTLTHEFGHLLDLGVSSSEAFKSAYKKDLENIFASLNDNPDNKIGNSDMTIKDGIEYFKHYLEGADFTDGIDESDITKRGLRENFAESFSIIFDGEKSEVNEIYGELFKNSINAVQKVFIA